MSNRFTAFGDSAVFLFGNHTVVQIVTRDLDEINGRISENLKERYSHAMITEALSIWLGRRIDSIWENLASGSEPPPDLERILTELNAPSELYFVPIETEQNITANENSLPEKNFSAQR